jgi:outer membrane protein OmpA-like peptidoglycan-associated protein
MKKRIAVILALLVMFANRGNAQEPKPEERKNFVSCPIVQDTKTVPCWLSEYRGELYYLGIQTDISAEFHPPYLGHKALVEGIVSDEPRICGGIVLKPVVVSPLPELDSSCNTILPAVDKYTVPFAPRPPGPSGGTLAFQAPPRAPEVLQPPFAPREFSIYYDFDNVVGGRHSGILSQIVDYAEKTAAARVVVTSFRGSTLLSDGAVLTEQQGIAKARAEEVADLLKRAGVVKAAIQMNFQTEPESADGREDWKSRRTTVRVEPAGK